MRVHPFEGWRKLFSSSQNLTDRDACYVTLVIKSMRNLLCKYPGALETTWILNCYLEDLRAECSLTVLPVKCFNYRLHQTEHSSLLLLYFQCWIQNWAFLHSWISFNIQYKLYCRVYRVLGVSVQFAYSHPELGITKLFRVNITEQCSLDIIMWRCPTLSSKFSNDVNLGRTHSHLYWFVLSLIFFPPSHT